MGLIASLKALVPQRSPLRLTWHRIKVFLAALRSGFPACRLRTVAVTGTDGKTTTVAMTAHILHAVGVRVGAVSTTFFRIGSDTWENPTHKTSLSPSTLQRFLRRCAREGCETVVVEASSHGLVQHRLDFLWPQVAAITNTALEHLDYHGTMEQYRADKALLFRMLRGRGTKVLNADDETFASYRTITSERTIATSTKRTLETSLRDRNIPAPQRRESNEIDAGFWARDRVSLPNGTSATLHCTGEGTTWKLQLAIPGAFNVANALCAIACAHAVGVPIARSVEALRSFPGVPGRLERIDEGQSFAVYVDFTISPQAYEAVLSTLRETLEPSKRLLLLTGSCGDRMREKRPMIGEIGSRLADVVVVTEDETLTEDPLQTIEDVWAGIDHTTCQAHKIPDRREAIRLLLREARPGDTVALCGMGACQTMQTRQGLRPWDEREVAREELRRL
jgi:UDP-N-acetylmuramoyl-L-alanyl-D-glutamate--2,6-diaminopimelate ligase